MTGFESVVGVNPWTALFTFCNMMITFAVLGKFLFKPVKKMIDDRQKEIDSLYEDADNAKKEAMEMEEQYKARLTGIHEEKEEILRDAVSRAQQREKEILDQARADINAMREKARADIALEKKNALNQAKDEISGIAMAIAEKVVERQLNEDDQEKLVNQFIDNLGGAL